MTETDPTAPYVVTLGTAGGPRWWQAPGGAQRAGIATAVVVGDATYLVDCGEGAAAQLARAGLPISSLRGVFLTHLHSDHTVGLAALTVFGFMHFRKAGNRPVRILGPGNRGSLPAVSARAVDVPEVLFADNPTRGTTEMFNALMQAYSTDLADRMLDSLRPSPFRFFEPEDIQVPATTGYHPDDNPTPDMEPFEVYRDDRVTVTATLVRHPPVAPAFAFRFETTAGSVTISGDTAPCDNLVRLARDTDLLLHEAIDFRWAERAYAADASDVAAASLDHHRKSHTSPTEAGEIAARADARALALHHLVPGNADPSAWGGAAETFSGSLRIPDDLDVIPFTRVSYPAACPRIGGIH